MQYDKGFVNTFIIATYGVMNYQLLMPNLGAIYAKPNDIQKIKLQFALEVSFIIYLFNTCLNIWVKSIRYSAVEHLDIFRLISCRQR